MRQVSVLWLVVLIVISGTCLTSPTARAQSRPLDVEYTIMNNPYPGKYLLAPTSQDSVGFLDHSATWANVYPANGGTNFQVHDGDRYSLFVQGAGFVVYDALMNPIDTVMVNGYGTDFHDLRITKNGNYLLIGEDSRVLDLSNVVPGGRTNARVLGSIVQEVTRDGKVVMTWKSLDHIPVTEATIDIELAQNTIDYIHINSIWEDTDGHLILSCRHLDQVIKINRTSGQIIWRIGGSAARKNDFQFLNDTTSGGFIGFSHQHTVSRLTNGDLLVFDNGTLRDPQYSRAVIYRISEAKRTIERVWEFRHTPDIYTNAMGSADELPNGNILIGWGRSDAKTVGTEVTRQGFVEAEFNFVVGASTFEMPSYRAMKHRHRMGGDQRVIKQTGIYSFEGDGYPTYVSAIVGTLLDSTLLSIERFDTRPDVMAFAGQGPCTLFPIRWVVRTNEDGRAGGALRFDLRSVPGLEDPSTVAIYHRNAVGVGPFTDVTGDIDVDAMRLLSRGMLDGEYVLGSRVCPVPGPYYPEHQAINISVHPRLEWTASQQSRGYQVQIASAATFAANTIVDDVVVDTTYVDITNLRPYQTFYWRVRGLLKNNETSTWSTTMVFRTRLMPPTPVSPIVGPVDTIAVPTDVLFTWEAAPGATKYEIRIRDREFPMIDFIVDTVTGTSYSSKRLQPATFYYWGLRSLTDTSRSNLSDVVLFRTSTAVPANLRPSSGIKNLDNKAVRLMWSPVAHATGYGIRVVDPSNNVLIVERSMTDTTVLLPALEYGKEYSWTVRSVDDYGTSRWSAASTFSTAAEGTLAAPVLVTPQDFAVLPFGDIRLEWQLAAAEYFSVEVSRTPSFQSTVWKVDNVRNIFTVIPGGSLDSGTTYHWRVRGYTSSLTGAYSEVRSFRVSSMTDPKPRIGLDPISPLDGATEVGTSGTFVFTSDSRCDEYYVEIFQNNVLIGTIYSQDTVVPYQGLQTDRTYEWRAGGLSARSFIASGMRSRFSTVTTVSVAEAIDPCRSVGLTIGSDGTIVIDASTCGSAMTVSCYDILGRVLQSIDVAAGQRSMMANTRHHHGAAFLEYRSADGVRVVPVYLP